MHGAQIMKNEPSIIINFLREYVEEFGRPDTEQIIKNISELPQTQIDKIISDHKNLTYYIHKLW